jgi:NAD-dependent SIR2 family protein deacetylase
MNEEEQRQIERETEERERDFSRLSEIKNCPKCGGELEKGLMQVGRSIVFWGKENLQEKLISWWAQQRDLQAWRCKKCQLAVFPYGENKGVKL